MDGTNQTEYMELGKEYACVCAMITLFGNNVKFEAMRKELCGVVQAARNPFLATTTDIFTFNSRSKIKCSPVNGWFQ